MRPLKLASLGLALSLLAASQFVAPAANACGGFFCNAQIPTPIFQAGERVLFVKHGEHVTMHVEVTYDGSPTEFAWLIPVPAVPTDVTGQPLPLGQVLGLSSQMLFPTLQAATDPTWQSVVGPNEGVLCDGGPGGGCADSMALNESAGGLSSNTVVPTDPGVTVSDRAKVGPYDAELLEATSSDALYDWLNTNGYQQDPAAKPLLAHYVSQGFSFIGIRLQNGKESGDIKPVALTLGENAPCVPLRLTSIAAVAGMPIRVWVLGEGRAIPKNFLHAVVNERSIEYPGGENYNDVVDGAIQAAGGMAFVTEFAGVVTPLRGQFLGSVGASATISAIEGADSAGTALLAATQAVGDDNIDLEQLKTEAPDLELSVLKARLVDELIRPLAKIETLLAEGTTLTRLYTRIDPANMTRDPIFAFNPSLPDVAADRIVEARRFTDTECKEHIVLTYPDGVKRSSPNMFQQTVAFPGESPLARIEVLDESGDPVVIDLQRVDEVNALLDRAVMGTPTLPPAEVSGFAATPVANTFDGPPGYNETQGCVVGGSDATAFVIALCCGLLWWRRRRGSETSFA